jgi:hypothetical protein
MKLAESWPQNEVIPPLGAAFHDEAEEYDEVDEAKDGWVCVQWQQHVLKKHNTSNKLLHELAREIRGVEKAQNRKLKATGYKTIFDKWEGASRPFLRTGHDYFTEFLAKLDCVTVPKGETLKAAFERAKIKSPPTIILMHPNSDVHLFASLCRELQEMAGEQPFMLCQMSVAKLLFGHSHHRNISNWVKALKTLRLLELAEQWKLGKASRYFYVE